MTKRPNSRFPRNDELFAGMTNLLQRTKRLSHASKHKLRARSEGVGWGRQSEEGVELASRANKLPASDQGRGEMEVGRLMQGIQLDRAVKMPKPLFRPPLPALDDSLQCMSLHRIWILQ